MYGLEATQTFHIKDIVIFNLKLFVSLGLIENRVRQEGINVH